MRQTVSHQIKEEIAQQMTAARADTLRLFDMAREEDLHQSPGFGFRPIIWHLAHIGVFEGYWLLQKMQGERAPDERYERIFDPINTPREESVNLPSRQEMESYLKRVRVRATDYLDKVNFDEMNPLLRDGYVFNLVLEHEYQHQETLAYLLHLLDPALKSRPSPAKEDESDAVFTQAATTPLMVTVEAGAFEMGCVWDTFAYDNELPAHALHLPAFKMDRLLTTNEEYAHFISEGGYTRREWWSAEGWEWKEKENWTSPLYWKNEAEAWRVRSMFDEGKWQPAHPVTGVSWYEAEAYARFSSKRLPTEAEWEKAASWDASQNQKRRFAWGDESPTSA
ncbi:MAG: ergothioneine biosynthesis protein EgtB, partial [Pyrinomonadaceae bacterium]|nr:ergothioneine biosynthesis protein EgtB [Pyrinomonadaceae bacterium]